MLISNKSALNDIMAKRTSRISWDIILFSSQTMFFQNVHDSAILEVILFLKIHT